MHPRQLARTGWQRPGAGLCPIKTKSPLDRLVDDLIDLTAEGAALRPRLLERGYSPEFLDANQAEASHRANLRFVREIEYFDDRGARVERAANLAAGLVTDAAIVTHLLANNYRPPELADIMPDVISRMCELVVGRSNHPAQVQ